MLYKYQQLDAFLGLLNKYSSCLDTEELIACYYEDSESFPANYDGESPLSNDDLIYIWDNVEHREIVDTVLYERDQFMRECTLLDVDEIIYPQLSDDVEHECDFLWID